MPFIYLNVIFNIYINSSTCSRYIKREEKMYLLVINEYKFFDIFC